jgi:hypothetical protein
VTEYVFTEFSPSKNRDRTLFMQRTNDIATASNSKLSPAFVLVAFFAGVVLSALCFALRGSIAAVASSSAAIPLACVAGAMVVRAIESMVSAVAPRAQRSGTA